ncbi:hypothetical protein Kisp02_50550 [Kineosporia sp. NBRC 101731]|nr:hypothetical protein Kisp02_50550 [Kineosporia sp. NBRC 101731]
MPAAGTSTPAAITKASSQRLVTGSEARGTPPGIGADRAGLDDIGVGPGTEGLGRVFFSRALGCWLLCVAEGWLGWWP